MAKKARNAAEIKLQTRLRVVRNREIALGPGKIELLDWLEKTGSIGEAAKAMKMSYMRAWSLIRTMNGCFKEPLVAAARGGKSGGGAELTPKGREVLSLYQKMERDAAKACAASWKKLRQSLAD